MGFEEFLPKEIEPELTEQEVVEEIEKVSPNQVYDIITSKKPDWQVIIYEMVHTQQLDPWDLDLIVLTKKYFEKIELMEETDFYISSKVILAAALLLRIKSEFLLNKHLKDIDEILFGRKQEPAKPIERIEIDESELPILIPKTPMSRLRKVTLPELMLALNKAINTESRRIKREVAVKRAQKLSRVDIPKFKKINLKDRVKQLYEKILISIKRPQKENLTKLTYNDLTQNEKEEKLATFLPLLYLSNNRKLWLEQNNHLDDIWIYLFEYFQKNKDQFIEELEEDIEEMKEELSESVEEIKLTGIQKARETREKKKQLAKEAKNELMKELGIDMTTEVERLEKDEKIEKISGFNQEN
jgi:segregation and condensation protein A